MAAAERYIVPEIYTDEEWLHLTGQCLSPLKSSLRAVKKEHQLLVIDVFSSWSGACTSMEAHLKRLRHQFVQMPDCLVLAKACSDNIEQLKAFINEPRPTFLFWARSRVVALLRGAHRPLLTRLVQLEATVEAEMRPRDDAFTVDLNSFKVIQCEHESLADLENDEVVRSIGNGFTHRLTDFFAPDQEELNKEEKKEEESDKEGGENDDDNHHDKVDDVYDEDDHDDDDQDVDDADAVLEAHPALADPVKRVSLDAGLLKHILSADAKASSMSNATNNLSRMKRSASKHGYP